MPTISCQVSSSSSSIIIIRRSSNSNRSSNVRPLLLLAAPLIAMVVFCCCVAGACGHKLMWVGCDQCHWKVCPACNVNNVTGTTMHLAAYLNASTAVLGRLLDIGGQELLESKDSGKTARELASFQGHSAAVAEIDWWASQQTEWEQAHNRNANFIQAARDNDLGNLKTLMTKSVDMYTQDADKCTTLHRAAEGGHSEVAIYLVQAGGQRLALMTNERGKTSTGSCCVSTAGEFCWRDRVPALRHCYHPGLDDECGGPGDFAGAD